MDASDESRPGAGGRIRGEPSAAVGATRGGATTASGGSCLVVWRTLVL
jgi:hypothetical protein